MSDEGKKNSGFAGLSSMASDVDETIEKASKAAAGTRLPAEETRANPPTAKSVAGNSNPASTALPDGGQFPWTTVVVVGGILLVIWIGLRPSSGPPAPPPRMGNASSPPARDPSPQLAPGVVEVPLTQPPFPQESDTPPPPSREIEVPLTQLMFNSRPPVGSNNVLSNDQIQYCLAEKIRVGAAQAVVDHQSDSDIDRFNEMVNDYNSRCGSFRYRGNALESARAAVEQSRALLEADGRRRFVLNPSSVSPVHTPESKRRSVLAEREGGSAPPKNTPDFSKYGTPVGKGASTTPNSDIALVTSEEQASIASACGFLLRIEGQESYQRCSTNQRAQLARFGRKPDLSGATVAERQSIESACGYLRRIEGPAPYYQCLKEQISMLAAVRQKPDMSKATLDERNSIESVCGYHRRVDGPAAYYDCINQQMLTLAALPHRPDTSPLSFAERQRVAQECGYEWRMNGPASYYGCLQKIVSR